MSNQADCIFCQIVGRQSPAQVVYEDDDWLVFPDVNPQAPIHLLIIPKKHFATLEEVELDSELMSSLLLVARKVARQAGIADNYRLLMNVGHQIQVVPHVHLHLLGGWPADQIPQ